QLPPVPRVPIGEPEDETEDDEGQRDVDQGPQGGLDRVLEQEAEDADREGPDDDEPAHPGVRMPSQLGSHEGERPRPDDRPDVPAEVEQHGRLRPELDNGGEGGAGVAPAGQRAGDPDVGARGDRQELGESLEKAEEHGLDVADAVLHAQPFGVRPRSVAISAITRTVRSDSSGVGPSGSTASVVRPASAYAAKRSATRSGGRIRAVRSTNSRGTAAAASRYLFSRYRSRTRAASSAYPIRTARSL